jgi:hypothetical protein
MSAVGALIAIVALLLTACSGSDSRATPTIPEAETTDPIAAGDPTRDVVTAIELYWTVWRAINNPPAPDDSRLTVVLEGEALTQVMSQLRTRASENQAVVLPQSSIFIHRTDRVDLGVDGTHATATECVVDDSQLIDRSSGAVLNGAIATYELVKTLRLRPDGRWRISLSSQVSRSEGVSGCATKH